MGLLNLRTMDKIFTKLKSRFLQNHQILIRNFVLVNLLLLPLFLVKANPDTSSGNKAEQAASMPSRSMAILHHSYPELDLKIGESAFAIIDDQNLLLNPSFESDFDDWVTSGYVAVADDRYVQEGNYYGYLWYNGGSSSIYQEVSNIIPGETYNLTWYGGTHDDAFNHQVGLSFYDAGGSQIGSTVWRQVDYVVGCCDFGFSYPMAIYNLDGTDDNNLNEEGISLVAPAGAFTARVSARNTGGDYLKLDVICLDGPVCIYPSASDDAYEVCDNGTLAENVGDNDSDLGTTTFSITVDPGNGTASIDDSGNLTYTSNAGFAGSDILTYEVCNDGVCCATANVDITVHPIPLAEAGPDQLTCSNSAVTLTASGGISYEWSTGETTTSIDVSPTLTTTYDVTVTDANNCMSVAAATVTVSDMQLVRIVLVDTDSGNEHATITEGSSFPIDALPENVTIEVIVGGTVESVRLTVSGDETIDNDSPYRYISDDADWNPVEGGYSVTVELFSEDDTNGLNCITQTLNFTIEGPTCSDPVLASDNFETCEGTILDGDVSTNDTGYSNQGINVVDDVDNGTLALNNDGTFTYTPGTGFSGNDQFEYEVCNEVDQCCQTTTVDLTVLSNDISIGSIVQDDLCGDANGSIDLSVSGGVSPYTFTWGDIASDIEDRNGLTAGDYDVTVADDQGCSATATITVGEALAFSVSVDDQDICPGGSTVLQAVVDGGLAGYAYLWSTGEITENITVNPGSTESYDVTVTDANTCTVTATASVTVNALPDLTAEYQINGGAFTEGTSLSACEGSDIVLNFVGTNYGDWTFEWTGPNGFSQTNNDTGNPDNDAITLSSVSAANFGTYDVTYTDPNGCQNMASFLIDSYAITVDLGVDQNICVGSSTTISATVTGGVAPFDYAWSTGDNTASISVTPSSDDFYDVTVTDANGCTATDQTGVFVVSVDAVDDEVSQCPELSSIAIDLAANDSGYDAGSTWTVISAPNNGAVGISEDGEAVYSADDDFCGSDQFTYELCTDGCCDQATVTITLDDSSDPSISASLSGGSYECDEVPLTEVPSSITDDCDEAPMLSFDETQDPGSCPNEYTITRTWTATGSLWQPDDRRGDN